MDKLLVGLDIEEYEGIGELPGLGIMNEEIVQGP
jgi:hypothetical protein